MKIKTSKLEGAALDWAVARAQDWSEVDSSEYGLKPGDTVWVTGDYVSPTVMHFHPSANWSQGGPLVESRKIEVGPAKKGWFALTPCGCMEYGPTHLIAAMRAIVAAELGDTVDVTEELAP